MEITTENGVTFYGKFGPIGPNESATCPAVSPAGIIFMCTRHAGHRMPHQAQGSGNRVIAEWSEEA